MKRFVYVFIALVLPAAAVISCGPAEPTAAEPSAAESRAESDVPAPVEAPSEAGTLVDGMYSARYSHTDNHGWIPRLEIVVENGNVVEADFDYFDSEGALKSEDSAYAERMEPIAGTYPEKFGMELRNRLVATQSAPVDTVSGATSSTKWFNSLAEVLMDNARSGETGEVVLPMNETYTAELDADSRGWIATIAIEFRNDEIVSVEYDEVQKEGNTITARKSEDSGYAERWEEASGVSQMEVYPELEDALVATGDPEEIDTITGATGAVEKFREVAAAALAKRR
jgi:major membrane immunogen (membrane-anchored lipoprotein)